MKKYFCIYLLFLSAGFFPLIAEEGSKVDFDTAEGRKKLEGFNNFSTILEFKNTHRDITSYFSEYEIEEKERENKVSYIKISNDNEILYEFSDFDLNGKFERWKRYENGLVISEFRLDEKDKLIIEETVFNTDGSIAEVRVDEKKAGYFTELNIYKTGKIVKTLKDFNGDGLFEEVYYYELDPEIAAKEKKVKLKKKKVSPDAKIFFTGFYSMQKKAELDERLSDTVFEAVKDYCVNEKKDIMAYKLVLESREESKDGFINRFELLDVVMNYHKIDIEKSDERYYILMGSVFVKSGKLFLFYRLVGPKPLQKPFSGSIQIAEKDFTAEEAAFTILEDLKKVVTFGKEIAQNQ